MALIYFYDSTDLDKGQLDKGLSETDHHWEFVEDSISLENINPETEVISVFVTSVVTKEIIESLPKLRLIACRSTGFNNVDLAVAAQHEVSVVNVPTYGEQTVAEYAFSMLLALTRRLPQAVQAFDEEMETDELTGIDLYQKTFGVIGTGHIGLHAIKIALGFGMNVIAYDPFPKHEVAEELGFSYVMLDELLRESNIVTLHAPYTPDNHHLLNEQRLSTMKKSVIIINTARGELIDTKALATAISNGSIGGAALDVMEGEKLMHLDEEVALLRSTQLPDDLLQHSVELHVLHKMPNVLITPHNAFNTVEAIQRINDTTCQNIIRFWYGDLPNKVTSPKQTNGKLLVVRHTESEWNATGQWTGITDVHLSEKGFHDAALLGQALKQLDVKVDTAFCSQQIRTLETLEGILDASQQFDVPFERTSALNERDYGDYTGKNKWQMRDELGEEIFDKVRRSWDYPIPNGETLRMVYDRVIPFYESKILPLIKQGKNVMLVAHGNTIRALMKYLEQIDDNNVESLEMLFGAIVVYDIGEDGYSTDKSLAEIDSPPPNA